jgi:nucleoside-diphosphate-sugar epimerase
MEFIQGDILDKEFVKKYCKDADVVHHLAGITDVPRTKSEASMKTKDKKLKKLEKKELKIF